MDAYNINRRLISIMGTLAFIVGVGSFYFYPGNFQTHTYISENALSVNWGSSLYSQQELKLAKMMSQEYRNFHKEIQNKNLSNENWSRETAAWLQKKIRSLELEPQMQSFKVEEGTRYMLETRLKAFRGNGLDAIVLSVPFEKLETYDNKDIYGFALIISFFKYLEKTEWRSKDTILLLHPNINGTGGAKAWVESYHSNDISPETWDQAISSKYINIVGALCFEINSHHKVKEVAILSEGSYGNLPNLDVINMGVRIFGRYGFLNILLQRASYFSWVPEEYKNLIPKVKYKELTTLASYVWNLASGIPTGDHAYFSRYRVDSVTISTKTTNNTIARTADTSDLVNFVKSVEGMVRSFNSLAQRLHRSYYFYLLMSPNTITSIGFYMSSFGLITIGVALHLVNTLFFSVAITMINSTLLVTGMVLSGAALFSIPYIVPYLHSLGFSPVLQHFGVVEYYVLVSILACIIHVPLIRAIYFQKHKASVPASYTLKAISMAFVCIFLSTVALMNFSFSIIATILIVPTYAIFYLQEFRYSITRQIRILVLCAISPISLLFLFSYLSNTSIAEIVENAFQAYNSHGSLLYFCMTIVYYPLNTLALIDAIFGGIPK